MKTLAGPPPCSTVTRCCSSHRQVLPEHALCRGSDGDTKADLATAKSIQATLRDTPPNRQRGKHSTGAFSAPRHGARRPHPDWPALCRALSPQEAQATGTADPWCPAPASHGEGPEAKCQSEAADARFRGGMFWQGGNCLPRSSGRPRTSMSHSRACTKSRQKPERVWARKPLTPGPCPQARRGPPPRNALCCRVSFVSPAWIWGHCPDEVNRETGVAGQCVPLPVLLRERVRT